VPNSWLRWERLPALCGLECSQAGSGEQCPVQLDLFAHLERPLADVEHWAMGLDSLGELLYAVRLPWTADVGVKLDRLEAIGYRRDAEESSWIQWPGDRASAPVMRLSTPRTVQSLVCSSPVQMSEGIRRRELAAASVFGRSGGQLCPYPLQVLTRAGRRGALPPPPPVCHQRQQQAGAAEEEQRGRQPGK